MTDAELAARLRANLVAWKQFQTERGTLRALARPGAWAFAIPDQPDRVHPQQVLYTDTGSPRAALPAIAGFYRDLSVRFWRVQVPPGDSAPEQLLHHAGYVPRDRQPAMGLRLADAWLEAPRLALERLETMQELVLLNVEAVGAGTRAGPGRVGCTSRAECGNESPVPAGQADRACAPSLESVHFRINRPRAC